MEQEFIIDFDSNWKEFITKRFFPFIAFFMPDLYLDIDLEKQPVFLDQELQKLFKARKKGLKITDKLGRIWLKNGETRLILLHIEVQARFETLFSKRMFRIYYRIDDHYEADISAFALFVDTPIPTAHNKYEKKNYGTHVSYSYPAYIVYNQLEKNLLKSDNIYALAVLANLYTIKTKQNKDYLSRFKFKKKLLQLALERGYERDDVEQLLNFIGELMVLPEELSTEYDSFVDELIKEEEMVKEKSPQTKSFAEAFYKGAFGFKPSEKILQLEKLEKLAAELHFAYKQTVEQIAEKIGMSVEETQQIIEKYRVTNQ
jgi:hypothetical protein